MTVWISFCFNCYIHHCLLVLRNGDGSTNIIHSREGVTKVDSLAMVAYIIGVLPLIKSLKLAYPDVTQPWYAENAGALRTFTRLETYVDSLTRQVPGRGYQLEPTNSVLIICPENLEAGK